MGSVQPKPLPPEIWECDRCGHKTVTEPGEQILAEFLCLEGGRRRVRGGGISGACLGTARRTFTPSGEADV